MYAGRSAAQQVSPVNATANRDVQFTFSNLISGNTYMVWCATVDGALSQGLSVSIAGFVTQPAVIPPISSSGFDVEFTVNIAETVACAAYSPYPNPVPSASDILTCMPPAARCTTPSSSNNGILTKVTMNGLNPSTSYAVFCALASGTVSLQAPGTTAGFTQDPKLKPNSKTGTGYSVTVRLNSAEYVKCVAMDINSNPSGASVYQGHITCFELSPRGTFSNHPVQNLIIFMQVMLLYQIHHPS